MAPEDAEVRFEISISPERGVDLVVLEQAVNKELQHSLSDGVDDAALTRAKTLLKAETVYARDGLTSMARIMGWVRSTGLDKDYFTRWPQLIENVTAAQVNQAAKDTLVMTHSVTGLLLPENTPDEATSKASTAKGDRS